jgi:hypothetical protein
MVVFSQNKLLVILTLPDISTVRPAKGSEMMRNLNLYYSDSDLIYSLNRPLYTEIPIPKRLSRTCSFLAFLVDLLL